MFWGNRNVRSIIRPSKGHSHETVYLAGQAHDSAQWQMLTGFRGPLVLLWTPKVLLLHELHAMTHFHTSENTFIGWVFGKRMWINVTFLSVSCWLGLTVPEMEYFFLLDSHLLPRWMLGPQSAEVYLGWERKPRLVLCVNGKINIYFSKILMFVLALLLSSVALAKAFLRLCFLVGKTEI